MLTQEQLDLRRTGVGASEVAAVMGLHPYRTPLQVYEAKVNGEPSLDGVEAIQWGNTLEPVIAKAYAQRLRDRLGFGCTLHESPTLVGEERWELATPDRIVKSANYPEPPQHWGLEIKLRSRPDHRWGPDGSDLVPADVYYQCLWGMWVTGLRRWDVAALFGGTELRIYTLEWNADLLEVARQCVSDFWNNNVKLGIPPAAQGGDNADLAKYLPATGEPLAQVELRPDASELHETAAYLYVVNARLRELKDAKDSCEAKIKQAIGGALGLSAEDWSAKWAPNGRDGNRRFSFKHNGGT